MLTSPGKFRPGIPVFLAFADVTRRDGDGGDGRCAAAIVVIAVGCYLVVVGCVAMAEAKVVELVTRIHSPILNKH